MWPSNGGTNLLELPEQLRMGSLPLHCVRDYGSRQRLGAARLAD